MRAKASTPEVEAQHFVARLRLAHAAIKTGPRKPKKCPALLL